jgi:hypothetical protein
MSRGEGGREAGGGEGGYNRWAQTREMEKKTEIKSNLKLAIEIYSKLIRSKHDLTKL